MYTNLNNFAATKQRLDSAKFRDSKIAPHIGGYPGHILTDNFVDHEIERKEFDTAFIEDVDYNADKYYSDNFFDKPQSLLQRQTQVLSNFTNISRFQGDMNRKNKEQYNDYDIEKQLAKELYKRSLNLRQQKQSDLHYFKGVAYDTIDNFLDNNEEFAEQTRVPTERVPEKYRKDYSN